MSESNMDNEVKEEAKEIPEEFKVIKETYDLFLSYFDSLNGIQKYNGKFDTLGELSLLFYKEKDTIESGPSDELILGLIIDRLNYSSYEDESDESLKRRLKKVDEMIESDERFQFIKENLKTDSEDHYYSNHPYITKLIIAMNANRRIIEREEVQMKNNQLRNMISLFENFISNLYYYHYYYVHQDPNIFKNEQLTYKEIVELGDFEKLKSYLSEKKATDLMRKPFQKWLKVFVEQCLNKNYERSFSAEFSLQITKINEAFERRHVITHNNSKVNYLYIQNVDESFSNNLNSGDVLTTSEAYIDEMIEVIKDFSIKIFGNYIQKSHFKNDVFIDLFNRRAIELVNEGEYNIAFYLLKSLEPLISRDISSNINQYNLFIIQRLSPNHSFVEEDCTQFFLSLTEKSDHDEVAEAILLDLPNKIWTVKSFLSAYSIDNQIDMLHGWPLFKIIENEEEYIEYKREVLYYNIEMGE